MRNTDLIEKHEIETTVRDLAERGRISARSTRRGLRQMQEHGLARVTRKGRKVIVSFLDPKSGKQLYAVRRGEEIISFLTLPVDAEEAYESIQLKGTN